METVAGKEAATGIARKVPAAAAIPLSDFRAALERAISQAAGDERIGPLLGATKLRMRFHFSDANLSLNLAADTGPQSLQWTFGEVEWTPKLELTMDSTTANRCFQGGQSLAIALARGQAHFRGESRAAIFSLLPATKLLSESYQRVVEDQFPALAL